MTLELANIGMTAARRVSKYIAQMPAETKQSIFWAEIGGKTQRKNPAGTFILAGGIVNRVCIQTIVESSRLIVIVLGDPSQRVFKVAALYAQISEQLLQGHDGISKRMALFRGSGRARQVQLDDICSIGFGSLCHKMRA